MAVDVWYHVGSKNEVPGRTGFAHLFEHVMFTGSGHVPTACTTSSPKASAAATTARPTTTARTTTRRSRRTTSRSSLWLESDRMGFLLDTLDDAKFNAQRDIVKNERRQRVDNQPYGRACEILSEALYPKGHPYSWHVIGSMADLSAASVEDVKSFFRLYYAPNNATSPSSATSIRRRRRRWITKYFGDLPRRASRSRGRAAAGHARRREAAGLEDRVQVPRLYVQWPTVGVKTRRRHGARRPGLDPRRPAHRAPHQGAGLRPADGGERLGAVRDRTRTSATSS